MRNPFRTEAEAFSFTIVIATLALAVGIATWLGGGWVGLGVFVGLALGVAASLFVRSEPGSREPAIWERARAEGDALPATGEAGEVVAVAPRWRILVVANETCVGRVLLEEVRYRAARADSGVLVVSPALSSHLRYWMSDVDGAREVARERLDASLAALESVGVEARGEVGDEDPLQAIEDALRTFDADEIIVSTHPPGRSNWLERDVVAKARETFPVPITHVIVDLERERQGAR